MQKDQPAGDFEDVYNISGLKILGPGVLVELGICQSHSQRKYGQS